MNIAKISSALLISCTLFAQTPIKEKIYYGTVLQVKEVMGYDYLKVDEGGDVRWVAIAKAPVSVGDKIGYDKKTVMHDFKSKSLGKTFKEIVFANELYLAQKPKKQETLKSLILTSSKVKSSTHNKVNKNFVKKEFYTIEEVHTFTKELANQTISIKAVVRKVAHNIMNRDWIHLYDKTGNEATNSDDLVATRKNSSVKEGANVIVTGKVTVNKDFGYGYFYPVIIEKANFKLLPRH